MNYIGYIGLDMQFVRLGPLDRKRGLIFIDMYHLPETDLSNFAGLIITNYVDENFMVAHQSILEDYLQKGGVIFSFAEMTKSYLPNAPIWQRSPVPIKEREIILVEPVHPLFEGINPFDLNYRQGVKGFFTRGYFPELPEGAEVIVKDQLDAPIIYIDRHSTNGTIINGSGTDLYQVYRYENSTAGRLADQIPAIIREEWRQINE